MSVWRWTFWIVAVFSAVLAFLLFFREADGETPPDQPASRTPMVRAR